MKKSKKGLISWLIACLVFVLSIGALFYADSYKKSEIDKNNVKITELEENINKGDATVDKEKSEVIYNATGFDKVRFENDNKFMEKILREVLTWDSYDSYMSSREKAKASFHLSDDSDFLSSFMPTPKISKNINGKTENSIDRNKLNMKYKSLSSTVIKIYEDKYVYFTLVSVESFNSKGVSADGTVLFRYEVDKAGNFTNVRAQSVAK